MYNKMEDFIVEWKQESNRTSRVLHQMTDKSLQQPVAEGLRTLGRIAWHMVCSLQETLVNTGLSFAAPTSKQGVPESASEIASTYDQAVTEMVRAIHEQWNDSTLYETRDIFGQQKTIEATLNGLVHHEIHHRGQLLILMRQAGLTVPDVYGPSFEQWKEFGMEPPEV